MAKKAGGMSKAEAVRQAIAAGVTKPTEASAYIKEHFGVDVKPQVFSAYKSLDKKKQKKGGRRSSARAGGGDPVELARGVKQLISRYGAGAVSEMVTVMSE